MDDVALVEGQTLLHGGRYRFLRRIGSGTFATILRAVDLRRGIPVAIKCIQQRSRRAVGEREAAVLKALNARDPTGSCAIVRLLDVFEEQDHVCLVLELLGDAVLDVTLWGPWRQPLRAIATPPQHKLHARVAANKSSPVSPAPVIPMSESMADPTAPPLSLDEIRQIAAHLCAALAFLHKQGLIHADIKPENIVRIRALSPSQSSSPLTGDRTLTPRLAASGGSSPVKLIDFGNCIDAEQLAHYRENYPKEWAAEAAVGFDVQTLTYRAPEVAAGLVISPAIDMWSLGCMLVECASGVPLFTSVPLPLSSASMEIDTETENRHLRRLIERTINRARPLSATCEAYQFAQCYSAEGEESTSTFKRLHIRDGVAATGPTLIERLREVSPTDLDFQDFVLRLLDVDPATRLTAKDALFHPFVQPFFPFRMMFAPDEEDMADKAPRKKPSSSPVVRSASRTRINEQPSSRTPKKRRRREDDPPRRRNLDEALKLIPSIPKQMTSRVKLAK